MANVSGIRACAVVDSASGFIVESVGNDDLEPMWEAAVDYWRTHFRLLPHLGTLNSLGRIGAIAIHHTNGMLVIIPCPTRRDLLVICIGDRAGVAWPELQQLVRSLDFEIMQR